MTDVPTRSHAHLHEPGQSEQSAGHSHHGRSSEPGAQGGSDLKDPVCGMSVTSDSPHRKEHGGATYYFCSARCLSKFSADPSKYAPAAASGVGHRATLPPSPSTPADPVAASAAGTIYTCPMHPQVRQPTPGNCPICGMALEPEMPTLEEGPNQEFVDFKRRFWWTLPLTFIVALVAMFNVRFRWIDPAVQPWLELVLAAPVVWWAGWPFFQRWWQSLLNRSPNMWTLIGTGVGIAYLYSAVATLAPDIFPASFRTDHGIGVYFEAAVVIVSLTLLGQLLELRARSQTSAAIKALLGTRPEDRPAPE